MVTPGQIRNTLDTTLGALYPHNPSGTVVELMSDPVLDTLTGALYELMRANEEATHTTGLAPNGGRV